MAELTLFENSQFGKVRVIMRGSDPWFVAKDVCDCLGLGNARQAVTYLDDDERQFLPGEQFAEIKDSCTVTTNDGQENSGSPAPYICPPSGLNIISEAGFYSLVLRSRKPEAKAFKRWVTHEVLPAIRKTGSYTQSNGIFMPNFTDPLEAAKAWIVELEEKRKAQAALMQEQAAHAITKNQLSQLAVVTQQLLVQQGLAGEYRTVKSLSWWGKITTPGLPTGREGNAVFWSPLGKALTTLCKRAGGLYVPYDRRASTWGEFQARKPWDIMRIADPDYDVLNVYPLCAINTFKQALIDGAYDGASFAKYLRDEYKEILATIAKY